MSAEHLAIIAATLMAAAPPACGLCWLWGYSRGYARAEQQGRQNLAQIREALDGRGATVTPIGAARRRH
jgi:hypothetical protein